MTDRSEQLVLRQGRKNGNPDEPMVNLKRQLYKSQIVHVVTVKCYGSIELRRTSCVSSLKENDTRARYGLLFSYASLYHL